MLNRTFFSFGEMGALRPRWHRPEPVSSELCVIVDDNAPIAPVLCWPLCRMGPGGKWRGTVVIVYLLLYRGPPPGLVLECFVFPTTVHLLSPRPSTPWRKRPLYCIFSVETSLIPFDYKHNVNLKFKVWSILSKNVLYYENVEPKHFRSNNIFTTTVFRYWQTRSTYLLLVRKVFFTSGPQYRSKV